MNILLFGPPGVGKSTVARVLAQDIGWKYRDTDELIELEAGKRISRIFAEEGERGFRLREKALVSRLAQQNNLIISLGGGSLVDDHNRALLEQNGEVVCLEASASELLQRLGSALADRPLLTGEDSLEKLEALLSRRIPLYTSFMNRIDTTGLSAEQVAEQVKLKVGIFRMNGMGNGYDVLAHRHILPHLPDDLSQRGLQPPFVILSDSNVAPLYVERIQTFFLEKGITCPATVFPAGEASKNLRTLEHLYDELLRLGMDRKSTILALGGGVVGDMSGFAAATYMRGISWVGIPTTLLAMADSSIGGKVGLDLPQGKNLVGAFHPPMLVVSDSDTLATLPGKEFRCGLAEVIKAGVVGDPHIIGILEQQASDLTSLQNQPRLVDEMVRRAILVKAKLVQEDPYERTGPRQALNFGHTVAHALERHSNYALPHGEAVAIGMIFEANLAEKIGLCNFGLAERLAALLQKFDLPTTYSSPKDEWLPLMASDKKRRQGKLRWALPCDIGKVMVDVEIIEDLQRLIDD